MTEKVQEALRHVNRLHPEVIQVFFGVDGRWLYVSEDLDPAIFGFETDVGLLEDAARSVEELPAAFALKG